MELQFVFGNPGRGKKIKKARRAGGAKMAKHKKRKVKSKRNPFKFVAHKKGKKRRIKSKSILSGNEATALRARYEDFKALPKSERPSAKELYKMKHLLDRLEKRADEGLAFKKKMESKGYGVKEEHYAFGRKPKGATVAKRKKKRRSLKRKSKKSGHKKVAKRKHSKKRAHKAKKHHAKKRHAKKHVAKKHHAKKKSHKRKSHKRRSRRSKSIGAVKYRFGKRKDYVKASVPKLKKGQSARKKIKRKKRRYSFMVKRSNPIFGSPRAAMNAVDKQFQKATGHDLMEAGLLFGAGAALPVIESFVKKVPGVAQLEAQLGKLGAQVAPMASSLSSIAVLGGLHYAIEKFPQLKKLEKANPIIRALIAASVVKAGSTMAGTVAKLVGMSGVTFTPNMSGINYIPGRGSMRGAPQMGIYPQLQGINFTPGMQGMGNSAPQMGIYPTLNGMGYSNSPQMGSPADFGKGYDVSDYGGGGGYTENNNFSRADFGDAGESEPILDQSGGMS